MKNKILLAFAVVVLSACTGKTITQKVHVFPEDYLIADCVIVPPPLVEEYMAMNQTQREAVLTDVIIGQMGEIEVCNGRLRTIRELKAGQLRHNK